MPPDAMPAGGITIVCAHCGHDAFHLLGPVPDGLTVKAGEVLPQGGQYGFTVAACVACGEEFRTTFVAALAPRV